MGWREWKPWKRDALVGAGLGALSIPIYFAGSTLVSSLEPPGPWFVLAGAFWFATIPGFLLGNMLVAPLTLAGPWATSPWVMGPIYVLAQLAVYSGTWIGLRWKGQRGRFLRGVLIAVWVCLLLLGVVAVLME